MAESRIHGVPPQDIPEPRQDIWFKPITVKCAVRANEHLTSYDGRWLWPHKRNEPVFEAPNWSVCNFCWVVDPERHTCEERVYRDSWGGSACDARAIVQHSKVPDPLRWYCKRHDPVLVLQKRKERAILFDKQYQDSLEWRRQAQVREDARVEGLKTLHEIQEWMDAIGIHNEDEWAGKLKRQIDKVINILDNPVVNPTPNP